MSSVRRAGKLKSETRDSQSVGDVNEDRDVEGPKGGLKCTSGQGEYDGLTTSNETGDSFGKKWKTIFYGPGGTAVPGTCCQCNAEFLGPFSRGWHFLGVFCDGFFNAALRAWLHG